MRTPLLIVTFVLAINSMAFDKSPLKITQLGFGISSGISHLNTQAFNVYTSQNVRGFKNNQWLIGAEGFAKFDKCMIGFSAGIAKGDKIQTDTFNYALSGGTFTFDWAYQLKTTSQWLCFPMISAGVSAYGIGIDQKILPLQSEMIRTSRRNLHISNAGIVTDVSMNLYKIYPSNTTSNTDNQKKHLPGIGLKIGYMYGLKNSSWTYTGGSVTEGPKFGMRMVYLKIIICRINQFNIN